MNIVGGERKNVDNMVGFFEAKKMYDEISEECLRATLKVEGRDNFWVYENILNLCKKIISIAENIEGEEADDEEVDEEVKKLNSAIKRVYFSVKRRDDDYDRKQCKRAFLQKWEYGGDPYQDLKSFAREIALGKKVGFGEVVDIFYEVLDLLKSECVPLYLEEKVKEIFEPYKNRLEG